MSKQNGRGGMGSHKHYVSGRGGPSPKAKFNRALDDNRERESRHLPHAPVYSTVREAMERETKCRKH